MKRSCEDRRRGALARQHDMLVQAYTARVEGRGTTRAYAPVADFDIPGQRLCPGEHRADEPCEGER